MERISETLQYLAAFSMAIEMGFETFFSLPGIDGYYRKQPSRDRAYLKRAVILSFCLVLCSTLYVFSGTGPGQGALFLQRVFDKRIPVLDVFLTALILTGGSRAIHDLLEGVSGRAATKRLDAENAAK
ncbi:MAG: hypothetical protein WCU88_01725 [Elusimicrobiota bacterium]|jgi:hypothetical protein